MSPLQTRYPVHRRGKETVHVLLEAMTAEELNQNIARWRKAADAKRARADELQAHAEALLAYRQQKFPESEQGQ